MSRLLERVPSESLKHWALGLGRFATPALLFVVLLIVSGLRSPGFFTSGQLASSVADAAPQLLSVMALTAFAVSVPAGVDLAIGPLTVLVNVTIVQWLVPNGWTSPIEVFAFAILLAVAFELLQGLVINLVRLQPIIVTLAGYLVLGGLNLVILPQAGGTAPLWLANLGSPTGILSPPLYVLIGCVMLWALISKTAFYRGVRMVGGNARAAYASGMRITATRLGAHVMVGIFAGVAGVFLTALLQSADPTAGSSETLTAVTAMVLGGASLAGGQGTAFGAILGALDIYLLSVVLGTIQFGSASSFATQAANGIILVLALGIGGYASRRRSSRVRARQRQPERLVPPPSGAKDSMVASS